MGDTLIYEDDRAKSRNISVTILVVFACQKSKDGTQVLQQRLTVVPMTIDPH